MKKMAESLGMGPPKTDLTEKPLHNPVPAIPDDLEIYDDKLLREADVQIDALVREGMMAARETFNEASDFEPKYRTRAREVGAKILQATVDAIRQKADIAMGRKNIRTKAKPVAVDPAGGTTVNNSQTNIYTDRETILKAMSGKSTDASLVVDVEVDETE